MVGLGVVVMVGLAGADGHLLNSGRAVIADRVVLRLANMAGVRLIGLPATVPVDGKVEPRWGWCRLPLPVTVTDSVSSRMAPPFLDPRERNGADGRVEAAGGVAYRSVRVSGVASLSRYGGRVGKVVAIVGAAAALTMTCSLAEPFISLTGLLLASPLWPGVPLVGTCLTVPVVGSVKPVGVV